MNAQETLELLEAIAKQANHEVQKDTVKFLDGDAPNGLNYRTYNQNESCVALGDIDHRKLKKLCEELDIDYLDGKKICLNIVDIHKLRDHLYPQRNEPLRKNAVVYTTSNLKGGTGKTTTCTTLATGLCTEIIDTKFRIGVIDLDPQGSSTLFYAPNLSDDDFSVGDILSENYDLEEGESYSDFVKECFLETQVPNLKILPARTSDKNYDLRVREKQEVANREGTRYVAYDDLKVLVDAVKDDFDVIFIDTAPNFNTATIAAHNVANAIILPVKPSEIDRDSTAKYLDFLVDIYKLLMTFGHPGYNFINLLPTDVDQQSHSQVRISDKLRNTATNSCFYSNFQHSEAVLKAAELRGTIYDFSASEGILSRNALKNIQSSTFILCSALAEQIINSKEQ